MGQNLFGEVVRRADLQSVQLTEFHASRGTSEDARAERNLTLDESSEHRLSDDGGALVVVHHFDITEDLAESPERDAQPFKVGARYRLLYRFEPPLTKEHEEAVALFARDNGRFNAWPYLRAFLSRTTADLDMPVFTLPLLKPSASRRGRRSDP